MSNVRKHLVFTTSRIDDDAKFIHFGCGGTAISISITHKISDFASLVTFLGSWSSSCRVLNGSGGDQILPDLNLIGQIVPGPIPTSSTPTSSKFPPPGTKEYIAKRVFFSASKIEELRTKVISGLRKSEQDDQYCRPSRIDVVIALIWKCSLAAANRFSMDQSQEFRPSIMMYSVNIRSRIHPPLSETSIGNLACQFQMVVEKESEMELHELVKQLAAKKADADKVGKRRYQGDDLKAVVEWGKPVWVTNASNTSKALVNTIVLMETKEEGGVEVLVNLWEEEMRVFECNEELLQFASINPNPNVV
ncbi:vinorine synthase-like [Quillaja saponaria]|uniref:Vinorine synthase-like n=1 Tax=Quillaja saponaria TaxID=32244 RepID=A0AAD7PY51_QUISA|nr:vinorine synthase-like [Quillaja saponaria]